MRLTRAQKQYIEKNKETLKTHEAASLFGVPEKIIADYQRTLSPSSSQLVIPESDSTGDLLPTLARSNVTWLSLKRWFKQHVLILIFLSVLVAVLYLPFLNNGFVSDDIPGISQNVHIGDFKQVTRAGVYGFRPLLYFLSYKLGGIHPYAFRIVNILAHYFSVIGLYALLTVLGSVNVAFFAASIFAVHPILIESVTWVSGGSYSLYTAFFILAFLFYVLSLTKTKKYLYYGISVILGFLSLMSAIPAIIIPLILGVFHIGYTPSIFRTNKKGMVLRLLPFLLMSLFLIYVFVTGVNKRLTSFKQDYYQENTTYDPLYQIPVALTSYIELIFLPHGLTLYHTEPIYIQEYIIRVLIFILLIGFYSYLFFKKRKVFFWLSLYFISLGPVLSPYRIAWIVAERYVYLGAVGIIVIIGMLIDALVRNKKSEVIAHMIYMTVILIFSVMTILRNVDWLDEEHIWMATSITSPSSWVNHNNLGDIYSRKGQYDISIQEFKKAIEINPRYGDAYNNLGNVYVKIGKVNEAIKMYQAALVLNPRLWQSYQNIAVIAYQQKSYPMALEYTKKALAYASEVPSLHSNYGIILTKLKAYDQAKEAFLRALRLDPGNQAAKVGLDELSKLR
ncbi:tetratricopeptide repeat protein [Candidatus Roizmanbacteria bacterium]|nr:tetratricopeptide repeat protein [Candidatus Roizmanbacteria bacterium]